MNENDERGFLHDLATPLCTAMFSVDAELEILQSTPDAPKGSLKTLLTVQRSLEKMRTLLHQRRELLIERGVPSKQD